MTIEKLYIEFQRLVKEDKIYLHERYNNEDLFIDFRKAYGTKLKERDEPFLLSILNDEKWKWFVPNVLRVLETFPKKLLKELIHTAIYVKDPSLNNNFIAPCIRVHDVFLVNDLLMEYLQNGNKEEKIGALQAFYWTRPHIMTVMRGANFENKETFGYKPSWSEKDRCYDTPDNPEKMTQEEFTQYSSKANAMRHTRIEVLLQQFFSNDDIDLRYQISLCLPEKIQDFPESLQDKADQYIKLKKNKTIPDNWNDLEAIKSTKHSFFRRLLFFFQKRKSKRLKKKGLISLKTK